MTAARFYRWRKAAVECRLDDYPSCPKRQPNQLSAPEIRSMREMVLSPDYAHIPTGSLAVLAARMGIVVASATTWYKRIKQHAWKRPRLRVYRRPNRLGIRASAPNEIWHIEVTIIRLTNNLRIYIHACIDNYSRYVLAWRVTTSATAVGCRDLIEAALAKAQALGVKPLVICDSGTENDNHEVKKLIDTGKIERKIAQVEIDFSNSIVEAHFRSLKVNFLYLLNLTTIEVVKRWVDFYFDQHNHVIPHAAHRGATPEEMYTGRWNEHWAAELRGRYQTSRLRRVAYNQDLVSCGGCHPPPEVLSIN